MSLSGVSSQAMSASEKQALYQYIQVTAAASVIDTDTGLQALTMAVSDQGNRIVALETAVPIIQLDVSSHTTRLDSAEAAIAAIESGGGGDSEAIA